LHPNGQASLRLQFRVTYDDPEQPAKSEDFADLLLLHGSPPAYRMIENPYTPGLPLEPGTSTFVSREDIFDFIQRNLAGVADKKVLALVGGRRTGKTSILKHLSTRLQDPRYIPVYLDLQGFVDPGLNSFFLTLASEIARELSRAGYDVPRLKVPDLEQEGPQQAFENRFLSSVREQVGPERVLLLAVDEFDYLARLVQAGNLPNAIFGYLRHMMQHESQLAFILSGTYTMAQTISQYSSEFFNIAVQKRIGRLERRATVRLIQEPVRPYGMVYDDLAVDEIVRLTACHPYFTQMLCYILVNRCNEAERSYATVQDVRNAGDELLQRGGAHLQFIWGIANREARLFMAALTELQDSLDRVTLHDVIERLEHLDVRPNLGQLNTAIERLKAEDIVEEVLGYPTSYRFTTQLYVRWLRLYHPLKKAVREI
jgi:hypothetical protein